MIYSLVRALGPLSMWELYLFLSFLEPVGDNGTTEEIYYEICIL